MTTVVILGSARSFRHTRQIVKDIYGDQLPLVDLIQHNIAPYNYGGYPEEDEFIPLMKSLANYDTWVLATPVYT
jgi:NAD(P)H-dependent FMN reductase